MRRFACLLGAIAAAACAAGTARATGVTRTETLGGKVKQVFVRLPKTPANAAFNVNVSGATAPSVTVDVRSGSASVGGAGVSTCFGTVCNYTYRPLPAGVYTVVLSRKGGAAAKVTLKVHW